MPTKWRLSPLLATFTFLGQGQVIFDPDAAVPVASTWHLQLLPRLERPDPDTQWDADAYPQMACFRLWALRLG